MRYLLLSTLFLAGCMSQGKADEAAEQCMQSEMDARFEIFGPWTLRVRCIQRADP